MIWWRWRWWSFWTYQSFDEPAGAGSFHAWRADQSQQHCHHPCHNSLSFTQIAFSQLFLSFPTFPQFSLLFHHQLSLSIVLLLLLSIHIIASFLTPPSEKLCSAMLNLCHPFATNQIILRSNLDHNHFHLILHFPNLAITSTFFRTFQKSVFSVSFQLLSSALSCHEDVTPHELCQIHLWQHIVSFSAQFGIFMLSYCHGDLFWHLLPEPFLVWNGSFWRESWSTKLKSCTTNSSNKKVPNDMKKCS